MKIKTSITVDAEVIHAIDAIAGQGNRSATIEQAVREFLRRRERTERDARDRAILDARAAELDAEMQDVLSFQAEA